MTRAYGFTGRGRLAAVSGASILWRGLGGWLDALAALADRARPSAEHYGRAAALYRSLRVEDVRACSCAETLARAADVFDRLRRPWSAPALTRPPSELGRAHRRCCWRPATSACGSRADAVTARGAGTSASTSLACRTTACSFFCSGSPPATSAIASKRSAGGGGSDPVPPPRPARSSTPIC